MKISLTWLSRLIRADIFSPKGFVRHAVLIVVLFALAQVVGLREFTTIISGTLAAPSLGVGRCALGSVLKVLQKGKGSW